MSYMSNLTVLPWQPSTLEIEWSAWVLQPRSSVASPVQFVPPPTTFTSRSSRSWRWRMQKSFEDWRLNTGSLHTVFHTVCLAFTLRVRFCVPPPQEALHSPHSVKLSHSPCERKAEHNGHGVNLALHNTFNLQGKILLFWELENVAPELVPFEHVDKYKIKIN